MPTQVPEPKPADDPDLPPTPDERAGDDNDESDNPAVVPA